MRYVLLSVAFALAGCCCHGERHETAQPAVVAAPAATPAPVAAKPAPKNNSLAEIAELRPKVSVDADGADLRDVIDAIARQAGVNIVVEPQIKETVTLHLRDIDWLEAVQVIARYTKCEVNVLRGGVYYVIDPPKVTISNE